MLLVLASRPPEDGIFSTEIPPFQVTLTCTKLTKTKHTNPTGTIDPCQPDTQVITYTGMCRGQRLMLGCFPPLLLCVIVWGAILTGWAYLQPLGSACFHALSHIAGVTGRLCHVQLFMWVLGIRTQVPMLGH